MFADEVAVMATALIQRLGLTDLDVEVVLGGGVMSRAGADLLGIVVARVPAIAAQAQVPMLDVLPVYGALVEAFDQAGADRAVLLRLRGDLLA